MLVPMYPVEVTLLIWLCVAQFNGAHTTKTLPLGARSDRGASSGY